MVDQNTFELDLVLHSLPRPGCEEPGQGFLPAGDNVPGYQDIPSAGPDDCAKMCGNVKDCVAWTLHLV